MVIRPQLRCAVLVVAVGAVGLGVNLTAGRVRTPTRRLTPEIAQLADWSLLATLLVLPYLVYVLVRRVLPLLAGRSRAVRWGHVAASIAVHLLLSAGAALAVVASDPDFPFGATYCGRVSAPDGTRTAYLFRSWFCDLYIYERASGGLTVTERRSIPQRSCQGLDAVRLVWDAGRPEARAVWPDGAEVGAQSWNGFLGPR